jgi:hypothetical protein
MKVAIIGALAVAMCGCITTNPQLAKVYEPMDAQLKQKRLPASGVRIIGFNSKEGSPAKAEKLLSPYMKKRYVKLGHASFTGPAVSEEELKQFAASVGGDLVFFTGEFLEMRQGSRMVVGSYTPPSVSYTTGSASGSSFGSGSGTVRTPYGPASFNTTATGSSYANAQATTFNPGTTTYVRENFAQPVFAQHFTIFQSPEAQLQNWENMRTLLNTRMPPGWQYQTKEQAKQTAAAFASEAGVPLPTSLR